VQKQPTVEGKVVVEVEDKTTAQKKAHAQKLLRDLARDSKWLAMLQDWETIQTKKQKLLKTRVRKGIPSGLRRFVWPPLAALADFKNKHPQGFYQSLLLRSLPQKHDEQLKKDLPRIAQENTYFKSPESGSRSVVCQGQLALYNVFKAYCIYDPNVGYVQGMDSIGCPCVMHMEEEDAFWMLVTLLNGPKYGLKGLYTDGMPLAFTYIGVFELFLRRLAPRVYRKLQDEGVQTMGYAFRWLTTRFNLFPVELRLRILDIFINEGMKIIYRLSLYLVLSHKREILNGDMESIMMLFQGMYCDPKMFDADRVIAEAEKTVRITTRQMQEYTREYYQANISGVNAV
jgi:hypothetical protein